MLNSYLEACIYPESAFGGGFDLLPGIQLYDVLECNFEISEEEFSKLRVKVEQSTRKLCMMWHAAEEAIRVEREFYQSTIQDAPVLIGEDAVRIHYHLEAMILFARSAMDIASTAFAWTLPDPFNRKRCDSFNDLLKAILKLEPYALASYFQPLREDKTSWVSVISGSERGRSLRDKLAHQTEFPIRYVDIGEHTEKRHAVVYFGERETPLPEFIQTLCRGVVSGYLEIEAQSLHHIRTQAADGAADI